MDENISSKALRLIRLASRIDPIVGLQHILLWVEEILSIKHYPSIVNA